MPHLSAHLQGLSSHSGEFQRLSGVLFFDIASNRPQKVALAIWPKVAGRLCDIET